MNLRKDMQYDLEKKTTTKQKDVQSMAYSSLYSDDGAQEVNPHSSSLHPSGLQPAQVTAGLKNIHKRFAAFSGKVVVVFKCPSPSRRSHSHSLFKTFKHSMSPSLSRLQLTCYITTARQQRSPRVYSEWLWSAAPVVSPGASCCFAKTPAPPASSAHLRSAHAEGH